MQTDYCLFINRKSGEFVDFTDLPFGNLEELTRVAESALKITYVLSANILKNIKRTTCERPFWGLKPVYEEENQNVRGDYSTEEQFEKDLRKALKCDTLFDALYRNKEQWKEFLERRT